jgi:alkyl hydroperoxide reductase subunit F
MIYDTIIIGAGPAGMSAGIYTCRKKLATLILSKDIGGQTAKSWDVENYLGYQLISGADLAQKFNDHLKSFNCVESKIGQTVAKITKAKNIFVVNLQSGQVYQTKTIIIASGKKPRELNVAGEQEYKNKGVTYCATCDAPIFKDKAVAVVGGGDAALDATYQLTKIAKEIYLLVRDVKFKANLDKVLLGNVINSAKVKVIFNAITTKISGSKFVESLAYQDSKDKGIKELAVSGVFVEIGSLPVVDFCRGIVKLNNKDEIIIDEHNMTSVAGIFAAGDVTNVIEKQTIIAAGEGAKAAIGVANFLSRIK